MEKFPYARVEQALAAVFGISADVQVGMLRGRLIHLRRLGFGPKGSGRGTRIDYDYEAVCRWLIALKFEDIGIDPLIVINLIERTWEDRISKIVALANKKPGGDVFMAISYPLLRAAWDKSIVPTIRPFRLRDAHSLGWLGNDQHACVFNLSACLRTLNRELAPRTFELQWGKAKQSPSARRQVAVEDAD
jgi:hypothetical protein